MQINRRGLLNYDDFVSLSLSLSASIDVPLVVQGHRARICIQTSGGFVKKRRRRWRSGAVPGRLAARRGFRDAGWLNMTSLLDGSQWRVAETGSTRHVCLARD